MADLVLKTGPGGTLNLQGTLTLAGQGGKVKVGDAGLEALVEVLPSASAQSTTAPPVMLPPPPASPATTSMKVWIVTSFNKTVKAQSKAIVALGMVMQGDPGAPIWPGMMQPSTNTPTVTINCVAINVVNDMAAIFPSGGMATFSSSGQT